ncbi:fatty acyl-CoA reductase 1-like [Argiope bruennichi]|uniref:fatty acyl-CoA reductase 1-like n=1 Tax=Argiope bruennichi TaxID=94029 RepID=UPI00249455BA|nr:fatty acyl-CoA reductase 1-like [Argiope bruennichi]XP_055948260.1 fatty acyl-CoA reductase 1-like [Argiope bruennichi]XP_055948261.1 fatty acyl-CoA reductase 1-like [Argiope bruennichi]
MSTDRDDDGGYASPIEEGDTSQVSEFFKDRCVFITGVSGFVGKVLLEKLLRSCQRVRTVYVLMRPKDGQEPRQRLDQLFTCQVFSRLKRENPRILTRVVPISGDISLPELGLSQTDTNMLAKQVSVVFHSAATVRFDEPLKKSVDLNMLGTRRVLELGKRMSKLAAFIHVSTAYSYCNRKEIDEIIYPENISPQKVIDIAEWMDDSMLESILPKLMDGRPTTYHYSKALAEHILVTEGPGLPLAIVRPSIVTAAFKEPMPGWVDGVNGPSTFIIMTGKGLLRTMLVYKGSVVDWMPVDMVANLLLTAAWHIGTHRPDGVKVYNCTSGDLNKVTWLDIHRTATPIVNRFPSLHVIRYPGGSFKSHPLHNKIAIKLFHTIPAYVVDTLSWIFGHKTDFVSLVKRMERASGFLEYFTTCEWKFKCNNLIELRDMQNSVDRKVFDFDIRQVAWTPYLESYVKGVRKFLLQEDDSTLPAARRRLARLYYTELLAKTAVFLGIVHVLLTKTSLSQHLLWFFINLIFHIMQRMPKSWLKYLTSH